VTVKVAAFVDAFTTILAVAVLVRLVRYSTEVYRVSHRPPVMGVTIMSEASVAELATVNGSTTPAFAALTHATDRTIEEMKVVLRI
jgi:hypothetical protein